MKRACGIIIGLAASACAGSPEPRPATPCPSAGPPVVEAIAGSATADVGRDVGGRGAARGDCPLPAAGPAQPESGPSSPPSGQAPASSESAFGPSKAFPELLEFREQFSSGRCGEYLVESTMEPAHSGAPPVPSVRIKRADGTLVAQLLPYLGIDSYFPSVCGDLTGDGIMELLVSYSSGGAHCCHTDIVLTLEPKPRVLLAMDMGDGGYAGPVKLLPGKRYQLVSRDMVLAGAEMAVPYAGVPSLPMILDWDGKAFVNRTKRFPDFVRKRREETLKETPCETTDPADDSCDLWRGTYIGAMSRLVGDWPQQRARLPPRAQRAGDKVIGQLDAVGH